MTDPALLLSPTALWTRYGPALLDGAVNVLAAAAIFVFGLWFARRLGRIVRRVARKSPRIDDTLAGFLAQLVRYAVIGFVILAVLQRFGVETTSIVAVIGATTLAIGLALQGTLSNVAAGTMLILFRPYRLNDFVEVAGANGVVADVGLFTTTLRTLDGVMVTLPNGLCWGAPIKNFTILPNRRAELRFGVSYDTPLDQALAVVERTVRADARVISDPAPVVKIGKLGDFAVEIVVFAWMTNEDWFETRLDLMKAVKEALDTDGIQIPFPTTMNYEVRLDEPRPPLGKVESGFPSESGLNL